MMSAKGARHATSDATYVRAFVIGVLAVAAITYWAFAKTLPFADHFEIRADVTSAGQLKKGDPVRVAGLQIGRVQNVDARPGRGAVLTLRLNDGEAQQIHDDATLAIRPRLAFEGNFYVDLHPGTPRAPKIAAGTTLPDARTTVPVQLDQVLDVLGNDTRRSLQSMLRGLGRGLDGPTGDLKGSGTRGLKDAAVQLDRALDSVAATATAARGQRPGDLGKAIRGAADLNSQIGRDPSALADLVTSYDRTFAALADRDADLAATVRELDTTLAGAPRQLTDIDHAIPPFVAFSRALQPALRAAPGPLSSITRLLNQLRALTRDDQLPSLLRRLAPVTAALPTVERELTTLTPKLTDAFACISHNVVPTLNKVIEDGPNTSGQPVWQELVHMFTALAGASPNFDANGTTIRLGLSESELASQGALPNIGAVVGKGEISGINPVYLGPGKQPPWRPDQRCADQDVPDLNARRNTTINQLDGFRTVPISATARRRANELRTLFQGPSGRAKLLKQLLAELPLPKKHRKTASGRAPGLNLPVLKPTAPKTPPSAPAARPVDLPKIVRELPGRVTDTVRKILDGLLKPQGGGR